MGSLTMGSIKAALPAILMATLLAALKLDAQNGGDKPASVQGTVIDSVSRLPIPRVHVTLQGQAGGQPVRYGTTSSADGSFSITGISPGSYSAGGERIGFVSSWQARGRTSVAVKADERKTGVEVQLTPTGSITGRVTDSDGEPVEGASVQAEGARGGRSGTTDEHGQFRIGGLTPGKYSVRADHSQILGGRPEIRTDGTVEVHHAVTYYPAALTQREAGKVTVPPGGETSGADIRLVRVPFVRVSGRVVGMPQNAEQAFIEVSQGGGGTGTTLAPDGSFEMWRLNPGKYKLSAEWSAPNGERIQTARTEIDVAGSNIDGIELRVIPDSNIPGRLEFEDEEARQLSAKGDPEPGGPERMVMLSADEEYGNVNPAPVGADGSFRLEKIPAGKYRVHVLAGGTYIKSMRLGATVIEGLVLDLSMGSNGADLSLLLSAARSSVSGRVQDDSGSVAGLTVVMIAANGDIESDPLDTMVGVDGSYTFPNVPPGNYKIAAVLEDDLVIQGDNVLGLDDQMETVTVGTQDKVTKDLRRAKPADQ
jgi:hypothetical protein